jgi:predicted HTH transcriptional regulator
VQPTVASPVSFRGVEWIRVGSIKKKLKDHPGKEKELWLVLATLSFEQGIAASAATGDEILTRLDYPKYFELSSQALPDNRAGILERMSIDRLIVPRSSDSFDITSLGAILFAKQLSTFGSLARKAFRVVRYRGTNRVETEYEKLGKRGYAAGFEGLIAYINDHVPRNEVLGQALRRDLRMYPERAIRELVANSIIHQDFAMTGTGPMVEIFDDRMEISNPGLPLIDPLRFIDHAPRSRNEMLADLMRRLGICEERGSGFDKVVFETEVFQLPAPDIRVDSTHTRIVLFGHQKLSEMDRLDKVRACYQHCALLYVSNKRMTNSTLRERFQIPEREYFVASRIIRDTINAGLIKSEDSESKSRKHARYVPFWS